MKNLLPSALLSMAMLCSATPALSTVSIVNGGFETVGDLYSLALGGIYEASGWQNLSTLNIQASSVLIGAEGGFITGLGGGSRYLRVASDLGFQGIIGQNLGTMVAGQTYTLTANYGGGASVNDVWRATVLLGDSLGIAPTTTYASTSVGATLGQLGSLSLSYTAGLADDGKPLFLTVFAAPAGFLQSQRGGFDDFVVTTTGSTVPEPASWAMLIAGFGFVGLMQRRRLAIA